MPRYNFILAEALHRRFKAACIVARLPMSQALALAISQWLRHPPTDEEDAAAKLQDVLDKARH